MRQRIGRFVVTVEQFGNAETQISVRIAGQCGAERSVVWVDDFGGEPRIYLHHDDEHKDEPIVYAINRTGCPCHG